MGKGLKLLSGFAAFLAVTLVAFVPSGCSSPRNKEEAEARNSVITTTAEAVGVLLVPLGSFVTSIIAAVKARSADEKAEEAKKVAGENAERIASLANGEGTAKIAGMIQRYHEDKDGFLYNTAGTDRRRSWVERGRGREVPEEEPEPEQVTRLSDDLQ